MNVGPLEDRVAIRELIDAFAVGAMRVDLDIWDRIWAEEGVWGLPSMSEPVKGKSNILPAFKEKMAYAKFISMMSFPADLVIEGDSAHGKAYCQEVIYPKTGGQKFVVGCFDDHYVKRDGRWYFLSRIYEVVGIEAT